MTTRQQRGIWIWAISLVAVGFGLLTIKEGGTILFSDEAVRVAAGNHVPFMLWFNFVVGFAYVIAVAGLWMKRRSFKRSVVGNLLLTTPRWSERARATRFVCRRNY